MNPNIAAAQPPKNLVHDIMPPHAMEPTLASVPVAQQAPAMPAPAEHPITGQPSAAHSQIAVAAPVQAKVNQKTAPAAQRDAHQPKQSMPILVISLAVVFAIVMIAAAFMAYRQS